MTNIFINSNVALKGAVRCQVYNLPKQNAILLLPRRQEPTSSLSLLLPMPGAWQCFDAGFEPALVKLECHTLSHRYQHHPADVRLPQALDS